MISRFLCLVAMILLAPPFLTAQSESRGKKFVEEVVTALGGDRFLHMQNRIEGGRAYSFYNEQLSGLAIATIYTEYLDQPPSKGIAIRERQVFGKHQDYSVLFLEDQAWDVTFRGARPLSDQPLSRYLNSTLNNILYILRERYNEPGLEFDYVGEDVVENREVILVDVYDNQNRTVHVMFDRITKLPVKQSFDYVDEPTKMRMTESTVFGKYRDVTGIMWPYSIQRERNGEKVYEIYSDRVQFNQNLPSSTFSLPPGVKLLPKEK
jgi:hypothetical protein